MKTATCVLVFLAVAGLASAQYTSVVQAVQKIPEVSQIAKRVGDAGSLTKTLSDPNWVGTVFIPTNAALDKISTLLRMDLFDMVSDPEQIAAVLGSSIVPGAALDSASLKEGQKLKAESGETLTVSYKSPLKLEAAGKTIFINTAPVATADIPAGKAALYLMGAPVLSAEYQSMLDSLSAGSEPAKADPVPATKSAKPAAVATTTATTPATTTTTKAAATVDAAEPAVATTLTKEVTTSVDAPGVDAKVAAEPAAAAAAAAAATPAAATPAPKVSSAQSASLVAAALAMPALLALMM